MLNKKKKDFEKKISLENLSQNGLIWYRFKKNNLAVIGLILISVLILVCFSSFLYIDYQDVIKQNLLKQFQAPNKEHVFGTDMFGRDLFSRIAYGGIYSLSSGLFVVFFALVLGLFFGGLAGYLGGKIDTIIMRFMDIFMSIPFLLMAMTIIMILGQSPISILIALSVSQFPGLARIVRSSVMTIRENEYIDAAKCYGSSSWKILTKHILPNAIGPVIVFATLKLGETILMISALGFVGVGFVPPTPEWGTILAECREYIRYYPYLGIIPGLVIGIAVLSLNFIGEGLRDALDPRTKK